jgi:hypothetical protein
MVSHMDIYIYIEREREREREREQYPQKPKCDCSLSHVGAVICLLAVLSCEICLVTIYMFIFDTIKR